MSNKIVFPLFLFLLLTGAIFCTLAEDVEEVIPEETQIMDDLSNITLGNMSETNGTEYWEGIQNISNEVNQKLVEVRQHPMFPWLVGVVIAIVTALIMRNMYKLIMRSVERATFIVAALSFVGVGTLIILQHAGCVGELCKWFTPAMYFLGILSIISLGIHLLIRVFPR